MAINNREPAPSSLDDAEVASSVSADEPQPPIPDFADVIIIGAGPTGLTLACELARRGVSFLIFDLNPHSASRCRALMLHARTLEVFADLGIAQAAVLSGHILRGADTVVNGKLLSDVKFSGIESPFPFLLVLDQAVTERLLTDKLEELGHKVLRPYAVWRVEIPVTNTKSYDESSMFTFGASPSHGCSGGGPVGGVMSSVTVASSQLLNSTFDDIHMGSGTPMVDRGGRRSFRLAEDASDACVVHVKALDAFGRPMSSSVGQIRCHYVIGCDGATSCVRKAAGIDFIPRGELVEYLIADITATWGATLSPERVTVIQSIGGGLIIVPMPQGRWHILCSRKASRDSTETPEVLTRLEPPDFAELQLILDTLVPGTVLDEILWISSYTSCPRIGATFKKSCVVLLGDAVHMYPPTFGQGLNAGVQDAYNVGWKLAAVLRGASPKLLDTYESERREVVENELGHLPNTIIDALIKHGSGLRLMLATMSPGLSGLDALAKHFLRLVSQKDAQYSSSPIVFTNRLSRGAIPPGSYIQDASVIVVPLINDGIAPTSESPTGLASCLRGGRHSLVLAVHVLPPGTKARTIFGCERNEEAVRWNMACLERLAKLGRLLGETFKGRETEVAWGGLTVVWILCGLVNLKSPSNTVAMGHIKDHVPHRLKAKISVRALVVVDYENEVNTKYGLRLADPDSLQGDSKSGAFMLFRPDGHICCNGYAGDSDAVSTAFDYALNWFAD